MYVHMLSIVVYGKLSSSQCSLGQEAAILQLFYHLPAFALYSLSLSLLAP